MACRDVQKYGRQVRLRARERSRNASALGKDVRRGEGSRRRTSRILASARKNDDGASGPAMTMNAGAHKAMTEDELRDFYGSFYTASPLVPIRTSHVPEPVKALIPYARFWGIPDDLQREQLVGSARPEIIEDLKSAIDSLSAELDKWLAGPEARSVRPSDEYVAFSA